MQCCTHHGLNVTSHIFFESCFLDVMLHSRNSYASFRSKRSETTCSLKQLQQEFEWLSCMKTLKHCGNGNLHRHFVSSDLTSRTLQGKMISTWIAERQLLRSSFDKYEYKQLLRWKTCPVHNLTLRALLLWYQWCPVNDGYPAKVCCVVLFLSP